MLQENSTELPEKLYPTLLQQTGTLVIIKTIQAALLNSCLQAGWQEINKEHLGVNWCFYPEWRKQKHLPSCLLKVITLCVGPPSLLDPGEIPLDFKQWGKNKHFKDAGDQREIFIYDLFSSAPSLSPAALSIFISSIIFLTCHHLNVSSERALFSLLINGWMDWLKRSVNQGSSSSSVMQRPQAQGPLANRLSDSRNANLKK